MFVELPRDLFIVTIIDYHIQFGEEGFQIRRPLLCWLDKFRTLIVEAFFSTGQAF